MKKKLTAECDSRERFAFLNQRDKVVFLEPLLLWDGGLPVPLLFPPEGTDRWEPLGRGAPVSTLGLYRRDYLLVGGMVHPALRYRMVDGHEAPETQADTFGDKDSLYMDVLVDLARPGLWLPQFWFRWGAGFLPFGKDKWGWADALTGGGDFAIIANSLDEGEWNQAKSNNSLDFDLYSLVEEGGLAYCS
jgi:hypothetical protein